MRNYTVVGIFVLALTGSSTTWAAEPPPKKVTIKGCQKKKPPVVFPHQIHSQKLKIACKNCHHKGEPGTPCSTAKCHAGPAKGNRPGCQEMSPSKNPFHIKCITCHKQKGEGPRACNQCHKK